MSKGHIFLAQNSTVDYVAQAYALALSIKIHNKENQTCLVTNDRVPAQYLPVFDHIIPIPWGDAADGAAWKIENRWKVIFASPFEENLVYDADMLLLNSNDHWWKHFTDKNLCFTSSVNDYRNNVITDDHYRKAFTKNNLSNIYTGVFYFRKVTETYSFFKWLEIIVGEWKLFYSAHLKNKSQTFCSIDVSAALAARFLDIEGNVTNKNSILTFTHMKPAIQGWKNVPEKWTSILSVCFDDECNLKVGNFQQSGVFHYVEPEFLQQSILEKLESQYEKKQKEN